MIATAVHGIVFDVSHIYHEQPAPYPCTSFAQSSLSCLRDLSSGGDSCCVLVVVVVQ